MSNPRYGAGYIKSPPHPRVKDQQISEQRSTISKIAATDGAMKRTSARLDFSIHPCAPLCLHAYAIRRQDAVGFYSNIRSHLERVHYKTTTLGPRLGPRFVLGPRLGGALVAPRHHLAFKRFFTQLKMSRLQTHDPHQDGPSGAGPVLDEYGSSGDNL